MTIQNNVKEIIKNIPDNVQIIAATKSRNITEIKQVINSGIKILGENYIQEAEGKNSELKEVKKLKHVR